MLLTKQRSRSEVYNDLDKGLVTLFEVLRDRESAQELARLLTLTPFARESLEECYQGHDCPIENSRRLIVRAFQGHGADSVVRQRRTGFRSARSIKNVAPAKQWATYPEAIIEFVERLQGVVIENKDWAYLLNRYDHPEALIYMDPPYLPETRTQLRGYRHEMTAEDHETMLQSILKSESMFVISGYDSDLYNDLLHGWHTVRLDVLAEKNQPRTEVLWLSPSIADATPPQKELFSVN